MPEQQIGCASAHSETFENRRLNGLACAAICRMQKHQSWHTALTQVLHDGAMDLLLGSHVSPPSLATSALAMSPN
jgi:hypothetical protein